MEQTASKPYVINKLTNKTAEILVYEQIGRSFWDDEGITAKQFAADIKSLGDVRRIDVRINSPGGSMNDGLAIYNTLLNHKAAVHVHIDGVALSMASVIAMAGETVQMAENALIMIHNPRLSIFGGDAASLRKTADVLDRYKQTAITAYRRKSHLSESEISDLMDKETFMTADEAREHGFVDDVTGPLEVAASFDFASLPDWINVPSDLVDRIKRPENRHKENPSMPETKEPVSAPRPATVVELKALAGASSDFMIEQLEKGATLADASLALNAKLAEDLRVAQSEIEKARATEPEKPPQQSAPEQPAEPDDNSQQPAAFGVKPLSSNKSPGNAERTSEPTPLVELFSAEWKRLRAEGKTANEIWSQIKREHPDWHESLNSACNAERAAR